MVGRWEQCRSTFLFIVFALLTDFYGLYGGVAPWFRGTRGSSTVTKPTVHARQTDIYTDRVEKVILCDADPQGDRFLFNKWSLYQLRQQGAGGG